LEIPKFVAPNVTQSPRGELRKPASTFFPLQYLTPRRFHGNISSMIKTIGVTLLFLGVSGFAFATQCDCIQVPEVNLGAGGNALALLSGAFLLIRSRKK
jgi:hypothetical protein